MGDQIKTIALYLPQYHEVKENNEWWGQGFTEWTNVKKAKSLFKGHYQPHIPLNNNYYDLSDPKVLEAQAELAEKYGVTGFCYYTYWFNGQLLLEKPVHNMMETGKPDFPFCVCWANENWTRTWDGQERKVLMKQEYNLEDDLEHIRYLIPFFQKENYIKIDGKPLFLMYRSELHPDIKKATEIWRSEAKKAGFPDLYLVRMENFERNLDPALHGFDAGMEFAPDSKLRGKKIAKRNMLKYLSMKLLHVLGLRISAFYENGVYAYKQVMKNMIDRKPPEYKYFRCIAPSWDNSARRKTKASIYVGSTPELFGEWADKMIAYTKKNLPEKEQILFINAWNEWGEGCHLEPDKQWGDAYLSALKSKLEKHK